MTNELSNKIYSNYINDKIGRNENCTNCREAFSKKNSRHLKNGPVPIYHVGENFEQSDKRILILGMVSYGWDDIYGDFGMWDGILSDEKVIIEETQKKMNRRIKQLYFDSNCSISRKKNNGKLIVKKSKNYSPFFYWIRKLVTRLYQCPETGFNHIAITNSVKCNDGSINNPFNHDLISFCTSSSKGGYLITEVLTLNPTHIVILTKQSAFFQDIVPLKESHGIKMKSFYHPSSRQINKNEWMQGIVDFCDS